jgi:hypothetical protein
MKKGCGALVSAALVLLLVPAIAGAWHFDYQIYGNILATPAEYSGGGLTSGGTGIIEITIDDTGWPVDPNQRWTYLWQNYFKPNYDNSTPGAYKWVGTFTGTFYLLTLSASPGYQGWCMGTITPKITIWDANMNGALDLSEKWGENLFDARLSKLCTDPSGGEMECKWGWGAIASNYFSIKMPPARDTLYDGADLTLMTGCSSDVQPSSWSSIKSLYR